MTSLQAGDSRMQSLQNQGLASFGQLTGSEKKGPDCGTSSSRNARMPFDAPDNQHLQRSVPVPAAFALNLTSRHQRKSQDGLLTSTSKNISTDVKMSLAAASNRETSTTWSRTDFRDVHHGFAPRFSTAVTKEYQSSFVELTNKAWSYPGLVEIYPPFAPSYNTGVSSYSASSVSDLINKAWGHPGPVDHGHLASISAASSDASASKEQVQPRLLFRHPVSVPSSGIVGNVCIAFQEGLQTVSSALYQPAKESALDLRKVNVSERSVCDVRSSEVIRERKQADTVPELDCDSEFVQNKNSKGNRLNDSNTVSFKECKNTPLRKRKGKLRDKGVKSDHNGNKSGNYEGEHSAAKFPMSKTASQTNMEDVVSVADRIEMELSKSMDQDASCKTINPVSERRAHRKEKENDLFSNMALSVGERIDIELGNVRKKKSKKSRSTKKHVEGVCDVCPQEEEERRKKNRTSENWDRPIPRPGVITFSDEKLYTYLIEENSESDFMCKNCKMAFSRKEDAESHVISHNPYKCLSCDLTFTTIGDMKFHYRDEHNETHHCTHCSYSSNRKSEFDRHIKSAHRQSRLGSCVQMVCYICAISFPIWDPMDEHLEKEHGIAKMLMEGDFQCPLCNAILRSDTVFKIHMRRHEGDYMKCPHPGCDYKSVRVSGVNKHYKAKHTASRNYSCPIEGCDTKFIGGNQIKEHLNVVHYKIRKFFCETCGKGFLAKKHLSQHERIHSDSKPVACKFCDYRCRQTASLKWHMKQSHPEEAESDANTKSTSNDQASTNHSQKRGRKATGKKSVLSARKRKKVCGNANDPGVKAVRRKHSSETDSDSNDV